MACLADRTRSPSARSLHPRYATGRGAQAATVVEEVDAERLACACRLFQARGLDAEEAQARSVMLYAYVFGVSLMHCGRFSADLANLKTWIAGRIAR